MEFPNFPYVPPTIEKPPRNCTHPHTNHLLIHHVRKVYSDHWYATFDHSVLIDNPWNTSLQDIVARLKAIKKCGRLNDNGFAIEAATKVLKEAREEIKNPTVVRLETGPEFNMAIAEEGSLKWRLGVRKEAEGNRWDQKRK